MTIMEPARGSLVHGTAAESSSTTAGSPARTRTPHALLSLDLGGRRAPAP